MMDPYLPPGRPGSGSGQIFARGIKERNGAPGARYELSAYCASLR